MFKNSLIIETARSQLSIVRSGGQ